MAGSPQPDGRGIQTIYLDDSRMVSFARITGGITDPEVLGLLPTAEGFRKPSAVGKSPRTSGSVIPPVIRAKLTILESSR